MTEKLSQMLLSFFILNWKKYFMKGQLIQGPCIFLGNQNDHRSSELPHMIHMIYRGTSVPLHNNESPFYFSNHGESIFRSRKHRVVSGSFREQRCILAGLPNPKV